jgi:hypothetical protein
MTHDCSDANSVTVEEMQKRRRVDHTLRASIWRAEATRWRAQGAAEAGSSNDARRFVALNPVSTSDCHALGPPRETFWQSFAFRRKSRWFAVLKSDQE